MKCFQHPEGNWLWPQREEPCAELPAPRQPVTMPSWLAAWEAGGGYVGYRCHAAIRKSGHAARGLAARVLGRDCPSCRKAASVLRVPRVSAQAPNQA